jgi:predicted RNase H-like HicB family nuclease
MRTEFEIEFELEEDGRWIAEIENLPGVLTYGYSLVEARAKAEALARQAVQE